MAWIILLFDAGFSAETLGILDIHFLAWFWKLCHIKSTTRLAAAWRNVCQRLILSFSDAHLVTGFAILLAGYSQACSITIYHFYIITYLGWISSAVHMMTLTISRAYLRRHRAVLHWRLGAMCTLFILLFIALAFTGSSPSPINSEYQMFRFDFDTSVVCSWVDGNLNYWEPDTVLSVCLLSAGFLSRVSKLFVTTSRFFRLWLRQNPGHWLKALYLKCHQRERSAGVTWILWRSTKWVLVSTYINARAVYDIYESLLSEIIWLSLSLTWGATKIYALRKDSPLSEYESSWGFGQILPLLLLISPIVSLPEIYHCEPSSPIDFYCGQKLICAASQGRHGPYSEQPTRSQMIRRHSTQRSGDVTDQRSSATDPRHPNQQLQTSSNTILLLSRTVSESSQRLQVDDPSSTPLPSASAEQVHLPPVFRASDVVYSSVTFRILIFLDFAALASIFIFLIVFQLLGVVAAAKYILNPFYLLLIIVPLVFGPNVFWYLFMAPFSPIVYNSIRYTS